MKRIVYIVSIVVIGSAVLVLRPTPLPANKSMQFDSTSRQYQSIINDYRASQGKSLLRLSATLTQSANDKAKDMTAKGYWSHNAPDGSTPFTLIAKHNYNYINAGENLSRCYKTPEQSVAGWIASQTHRENILADYTEMGIGIAKQSDSGCMVVVNHFGKPKVRQ